MITKDMLDNFRRSISVGETLKIENPFTANIVREDPEVLRVMSKEKYFCRITNGAYEFCINGHRGADMIIGFFKTLGILFAFIAFIGLITTIFVEAVVFLTKAVDAGKLREDKGENT